jgi:AP-1 complex subunit mu
MLLRRRNQCTLELPDRYTFLLTCH